MAVSPKQNKIDIDVFRKKILSWYNKHQRALPWRTSSKDKKKGIKPNPYHVWLSEIMLQQTTVVTVGPYFEKFIQKWPTIHDLAKAERDEVMHEWAGLGYYARARNLHKCAQTVSVELGGEFPEEQSELEKLSGIGGYTSAAIAAIAFDKPANVVDGNIERVMSRIYAIKEPLPDSKVRLKELAAGLSDERKDHPGDYAQALMDLGATICTPKSPKCMLCPVNDLCEARKLGIESDLKN
jgi:A/G-specific adenine glycosylase